MGMDSCVTAASFVCNHTSILYTTWDGGMTACGTNDPCDAVLTDGGYNNTYGLLNTTGNCVMGGVASSNCKTMSSANELYTLNNDVTSSSGTCFTISAANVTIDCGGYALKYATSSSAYGIDNSAGYANLSIKNCNISQVSSMQTSAYAVYLAGAVDSTVYNNSIMTNGGGSSGIYLSGSSDKANITDNNITTSGGAGAYGVYIFDSSRANVIHNEIDTSDDGVYVYGNSDYNILENNIFDAVVGDGIDIENSGPSSPTLNNVSSNKFNSGSITSYDLYISSDDTTGGTWLIDQQLNDYYLSMSSLIVQSTNHGQIKWFTSVAEIGSNFSANVSILNNSVIVNSNSISGLNQSSNISLFNFGNRGFTTPIILKNGAQCSAGWCDNFTSLIASTVVFNVTGWSNYSIGEGADKTPPQIAFQGQTPASGIYSSNRSIEINTTISDQGDLAQVKFNWNWTNESIATINLTNIDINFSTTRLTGLNFTANNTQLGLYGNDLLLMMNFENRSALGESSSLIVDLSKYGLNGTYNGNAVINATGKYGTAVNFDGSGDDIAFSSSPTGVNTISFWMNSRQSASGCAIVIAGSDVYNSNSWNWGIWMGNGASPLIAFTAKPGVAQGTPPLSLNTWTHVVLVRNSNGNALFYMNGNMTNNISSGSGNTDGVLRIGTAGTYDYNGLIDEIRIWNRSLSTKEIQQLYYSNLQKYDSSNWSFYNTQIPLNNYTFSADGARDNIKFVKFNTTNFDYYMNKSGLGNGDYLYRLFGRDAVGNTSSTEQRTIDIIAATGNNLPTATLLDPAEGNRTNNRKPMFNWSGADADGDAINYTLNISLKASSTCTDTEKIIENITAMNYTLTSDLKCLYDNGDYYLWSIRPYDGEGYGNWTTPRTLNLSSVISLSLPTSTVQFGPIKYTDSNDTTDNSPPPFIIQNNGNAFTNVTIDATSLWRSVENPNNYYKYKIANATGEEGAFHWFSITGFATMPLTGGGSDKAIVRLNYTDATDSAEIDVYVQVPPDEGSNVRNSTVSLTGSLAE
jgi:parallel beta-helix repeat protein